MFQKSVKGAWRHRGLLALVLTFLGAGEVRAQPAPGSRAAGFGGAFVGVADDASAVYWNPAGLVFGPLANLQIDYGRRRVGENGTADPNPASRESATLVAFGVPALGLSYYRLGVTEIGAPRPAESTHLSREMEWRALRTLATSHLGVTLLQSVGEWLTVGATAKLVRGSAATAEVPNGPLSDDEFFDLAESLETGGQTRGDIDVGAMVAVGSVRLGVAARNLTEPTFGDEQDEVAPLGLERAVRIGGAWGSGWPDRSRVVVAADADLTRRSEVTGERRDIAAGVETWWHEARLGLRGGLHASTVGDARPVAAAGVSVGVRARWFVDAHAAWGRGDDRGWGLGLRMVF